MADEIELKLELTPGAANALEGSGLLSGHHKRINQRSLYFDTPDRALAKRGLSLRIRRSGRKRMQTVKAAGAGAAGLFVRPEWEFAVKDDRPVLDDTTPIRAVLGCAVDALAPMFEVRTVRQTWVLRDDDTTIELVLDRGELAVGDRMSPICEIELELKAGGAAALFNLARRIDEIAPVRLGVQAKAERGYRLAGPVSRVFKAERVTLSQNMIAAQAFQHIVQNCVRQFRLNEALLLTAPNPEALHQARVALRRLRSAMSVFKPVIAGTAKAKLGEELRWLASSLGDVRNLDVLLDRAPHGPLHDRIEAARTVAYDKVRHALEGQRVRGLMLDLAEWAAIGDWLNVPDTQAGLPAREYAVAALGRLYRKVRKGGKDLAHETDAERHQLRKDAKKLRYAAEFFASLFKSKHEKRQYKSFVAALETLQDKLGLLNDLATAPGVLAQFGIADDRAAPMLMALGKKKDLLKAAADAYDALIDTKRFWQ